jgi:hypothetical protein
MAFKIGKQQLAEHDTLAADLCKKAEAPNIAIVAFNQAIGPLSQVSRCTKRGSSSFAVGLPQSVWMVARTQRHSPEAHHAEDLQGRPVGR